MNKLDSSQLRLDRRDMSFHSLSNELLTYCLSFCSFHDHPSLCDVSKHTRQAMCEVLNLLNVKTLLLRSDGCCFTPFLVKRVYNLIGIESITLDENMSLKHLSQCSLLRSLTVNVLEYDDLVVLRSFPKLEKLKFLSTTCTHLGLVLLNLSNLQCELKNISSTVHIHNDMLNNLGRLQSLQNVTLRFDENEILKDNIVISGSMLKPLQDLPHLQKLKLCSSHFNSYGLKQYSVKIDDSALATIGLLSASLKSLTIMADGSLLTEQGIVNMGNGFGKINNIEKMNLDLDALENDMFSDTTIEHLGRFPVKLLHFLGPLFSNNSLIHFVKLGSLVDICLAADLFKSDGLDLLFSIPLKKIRLLGNCNVTNSNLMNINVSELEHLDIQVGAGCVLTPSCLMTNLVHANKLRFMRIKDYLPHRKFTKSDYLLFRDTLVANDGHMLYLDEDEEVLATEDKLLRYYDYINEVNLS